MSYRLPWTGTLNVPLGKILLVDYLEPMGVIKNALATAIGLAARFDKLLIERCAVLA